MAGVVLETWAGDRITVRTEDVLSVHEGPNGIPVLTVTDGGTIRTRGMRGSVASVTAALAIYARTVRFEWHAET